MNNLVLIDKRVTDYTTIVDAIDISNGAHYIVFDIFELGADPFAAIQTKIGELNIPAFNSIGLVQHNYNEPFYQMFGPACPRATIMGVETSDASLQTWQSVTDFITLLKTTYGIQHFDLMACALYSDANWKYVIDTLSVQTGVTIRASADNTGSAGLGGNWFLESHTGVNMKGVYFTEAIEEYRGVLLLNKNFIRQYPTTKGISIGSVVFWDPYVWGDLSANLGSAVVAVYSAGSAFAALKSNGSVVTWGDANYGGNSSIATYSYSTNSYTYTSVANSLSSDVVAVYSAGSAFAALKSNGSVVTWGSASAGGNSSIATYSPSTRYTYTSVADSLSSGVVAVYATYSKFAALKSNGSVITWGEITLSSSVSDNISSGVVAVYSTESAFAALKSNGSVVTWGSATNGGDSSSVINSLSSGVVAIYSSASVFAALKSNGSVVTWGNPLYGGNSSIATYSYSTYSYTYTSVASSLSSGVVAVYAGKSAFAALKSNGSVIIWGHYLYGGSLALATGSIASGVVGVCSSHYGFAALKIDGSVVEWGNVAETMGANNTLYFILSSGYSRPQSNTLASNVVAIYGNSMGFTALKSNGTIIYWGYNTNDSGLNSDIVAFYYNCALTSNGSVINIDANLDITFASVSNSLSSDVVAIFPDFTNFALKSTATTFDLSMSYYTDMDRYNILRKKENRRRVNLTTLNNNVFTLSNTYDIQSFNPNIPSDKILRIIVPDYVSSPLSMTSTATIPYSSGSYIIASDEGEHVTISGVTYVNYGSYVYKRETNNTFTKLTTTTINENIYSVYGGDGINSSGIALVTITTTYGPFTPPAKTLGDAVFSMVPYAPTSDSIGAYTYTSSLPGVATINSTGTIVTIVGVGSTTITVSQDACGNYPAGSKTGTLAVTYKTVTYGTFTPPAKTIVDAPFSMVPYAPTTDSSGAYTYTSSAPGVATISTDGTVVTIVGQGSTTITASQDICGNYGASSKTGVLTISGLTTTYGTFTPPAKTFGDAAFSMVPFAPTTTSNGAYTYTSSAPGVATINSTGTVVTIVGQGSTTITASQDICGNYAAGSTTGVLAVARKAITYGTFTPPAKTFGAVPFSMVSYAPTTDSSGAYTYRSSTPGVATITEDGTVVTIIGQGSTTITVSQDICGNYAAGSKTGVLAVARKATSYGAFTPPAKTFGAVPFSLVSFAPTTDNNGAYIYTSSAPGVATINSTGTVVTIIGQGSTTITASQDICGNYLAGSTTGTLTVARAIPTYNAVSSFTKTYGNPSFSLVPYMSGISNSNGSYTFTSSNPSAVSIDGDGVTANILAYSSSAVTITANQDVCGNYTSGTKTFSLTVLRRTPTVSGLVNQTRPLTPASFSLSPVSSSTGTFSYVSDNSDVVFMTNDGTTFNVASIGSATITATITQDPSGNYKSQTYNFVISVILATSNLAAATFAVPALMTYGDTPVNITTVPTSDSNGDITYTSSNINIATIHPTTGVITAIGSGWVTFTASQAATSVYNGNSVDSNNMNVAVKSVTQSRVAPYTSTTITKYYGDAPFQIETTSDSNANKLFSLSNLSVVSLVNSSNIANITITNVGTVTITGQQYTNSQYSTQNNLGWDLTVEKGSTALSGLAATLNKNVTDAAFTVSVTSTHASSGVISYALSNPDSSNVLIVNSVSGLVTLKSAGTATIVASQAASSFYNAPDSVSCVITVVGAGSSLQGATITSGRVFDNVDMTGASLSGATVIGASFAGTTMTNADLSGAIVQNVTLTGANLVNAALANADISGTSFADATMSNVIMTGATVTNSTLSSVDLTGASMANANITGTTFADSTMTNAVLTGATLTNSTLTNTDLSGASLAQINVTGSSFVGATLANADLSGATVTNANFTNTNISGANITNVAFSPLQKIQLLKNINNRAISEIQVGEVNGSVILSAISGSSLATTIPNLASSTVKVIIPMTSTVSSDIITDIVLDITVSDKFYFPINDGEYFQILGVKYFINGSIVRNATTNGVVDVIPYGSKYIWLSVGSIIVYVLQVNTLSESTFTVPSNKNDTNAPFNITTVPSSNSNAAIVYSSNNPSVATIHPSTGVITIVAMGDVSFNATQSQTFLYEAGSVTSNTLHVSNILINFTLSGLDQITLMSICGRLDASAVYLAATDATSVFYVKLSDMREIFKYQSDSFDINDISASDIKYYVFNRNWPTALKINPAHAMLDKPESSGMLGNTTLYNSANSMAKHDFVRYLAKKLFSTIFAVSLFNNTTALLENETEGGEDIRSNMNSILSGISTTSGDETMAYDASGNKYLTNDTTSNTNICRELIRQVAVTAASRFSSVTDTTLPQSVPFIENDTINFRVSFHSTATQHLLTDVTNISARSYMVKLIMKESIDGLNTPVIDSAMFPNAYPYSSAVTTYAPTSASSNVYNIFSPPAPIPFSRFGFDGWYYKNSSAWVNINSNVRNHVKWLLPANSETATVGGLLYIRANLKIHNKTTLPYIVVYTQSGSWRKFPIVNTEALVNGTTYSFYVNFHLYTRQPVMNGYTNAALANTIGSGPFDSSEIILNIALETDSSAAEDSVEFTLATMIVGDDSGEKEYGFMADVPTAYP